MIISKKKIIHILTLSIVFYVSVFLFSYFFADVNMAQIRESYKNNQDIVSIVPSGNRYYNQLFTCENISLLNPTIENTYRFTEKQANSIKNYSNHEPNYIISYQNDYCSNFANYSNSEYYQKIPGKGNFEKIIEVSSCDSQNELNLTKDNRFQNSNLCKFPSIKGEIAITSYVYNLFHEFGYKDDNGKVSNINVPDDLIGKTLIGLTICGIYSIDNTIESIPLQKINEYSVEIKNSLSNYAFVKTDNIFVLSQYGTINNARGALIKLSGNIIKDWFLLKELSYNDYKNSSLYHEKMDIQSIYIAELSDFTRFNIPSLFTIAMLQYILVLIITRILYGQLFKKKLAKLGNNLDKQSINAIKNDWIITSLIIFGLSTLFLVITFIIINFVTNIYFFALSLLQIVSLIIPTLLIPFIAYLRNIIFKKQ